MNEERIKEVFADEAFVKQLLEQEEPEQVQDLLAEKEIDISVDEIIKIREKLIKKINGEEIEDELSDDDLEDVSGGGLLLAGLLLAVGGVASMLLGGSLLADEVTRRRRRRW